MSSNNTVDVGRIQASRHGNTHRVEATVNGVPLWFETANAPLSPSATALGTTLLPAALYHGRTLSFSDPFCRQWYQNLPATMDRFEQWWRVAKRLPKTSATPEWIDPACSQTDSVGLFFTGGVDSFHSLINAPSTVTHLLYVIDYDVPPQAPQQLSGYEPHLRAIANQRGIKAIVLRSNLRRHPAFAGPSWQQSHGAALIGTGHLLENCLDQLIVSSSYSLFHPRPWGSHWLLDSLWSSQRLQITHFGEECLRFNKVKTIVHDPLVQKYLRPCWNNPAGKVNCSTCEKCVRTQIVISACCDLHSFSAFDQSESLVNRIERIRKIPSPGLIGVYEDFLSLDIPSATIEAIERLLKRSRASAIRKNARKQVQRWFLMGRASNIA